MKTILVPTDFSSCAETALTYAIEFAKSLNQEIQIVLAHNICIPMAIDIPMEYSWEILDEQKKESDSLLIKLIRKHALTSSLVTFKTYTIVGDLLQEMQTLQSKYKPDLVVMGTLGASGFLGSLIGSNAEKLVKELTCDVLIVPPAGIFKPFTTILFGADLSDENSLELAKICQLAGKFEAKIIAVHVEDPVGFVKTHILTELWVQLIEKVTYPNIEFRNKFSESIETGLKEIAETDQVDLLVVTPRTNSFWESIFHGSHTRKMVLQPTTPTLCLKNTTPLFVADSQHPKEMLKNF